MFANSIQAPVRVESFSTFCHRQHFSQGVYYFTSSEYYDAQAGRVLTKPSQTSFVSPLREQLNSLTRTTHTSSTALYVGPTPPLVPVTQHSPSPPSPSKHATPSLAPSPQPQTAAQEHRDASPSADALSVVGGALNATQDIPNAPGVEADDSPGAREEEKTRDEEEEGSSASLFIGKLLPAEELTKIHQLQAETEKKASDLINTLKRRADALEVMLGSPVRNAEASMNSLRASAGQIKKSPRSPHKRTKPKPKVARTPLKFELVK